MALQNGTVESSASETGRGTTSSLSSTFAKYAPFIGLLAILLILAIELRFRVTQMNGTTSLERVLEPYRIFFELLIAGLVIAVLRSKVGLVTYGMFGPIIISFILVQSGLFWGLVLFTNIFLLALGTYIILEPFRLGTAHRIGGLVMIVTVGITVFHIMSNTDVIPVNIDRLQVSFPAIIVAWYADRFARELSERGWRAPAVRFSWTVVSILIAAAIIAHGQFIDWFMETPEAWAVLLAANVYIGAQSGLRAKEYLRFSNVYSGSRTGAILSAIRAKLHNATVPVRRLFGSNASTVEASTVLSMNRRNRLIKEYNPSHLYPELDKASMKRTFHGTGVPTPRTYALVESPTEMAKAEAILDSIDEFVIKPDSGYGGEGIIVVTGRYEDGTFDTSKGPRTPDQLLGHVRSITEGQYDPMGLEGVAVIEGLIHPDDHLLSIAGQGVPDIRVIVFKGFPIMAMTRLPTEESDGAANLHMGAVGVGLDVANGRALGGYQSTNKWFDEHPDTKVDLESFAIPDWEEILSTAVKAAEVSRLGYTGVDIVVDKDEGPMVLEINARPGLGIQNSTFDGLLERTNFIESLSDSFDLKPPAEKIDLARQWDAADWDTDAIGLSEQWNSPDWAAGGENTTRPEPSGAPNSGEPTTRPADQRAQPPSQGGKPPAQGGQPPSQGGKPPAQGSQPPSQGGKPPSQGGKPPAQSGKPPAQGSQPPSQGGKPPAQKGQPPSQGGQGGTHSNPNERSTRSADQGGQPTGQSGRRGAGSNDPGGFTGSENPLEFTGNDDTHTEHEGRNDSGRRGGGNVRDTNSGRRGAGSNDPGGFTGSENPLEFTGNDDTHTEHEGDTDSGRHGDDEERNADNDGSSSLWEVNDR